MTTVAYTNNIMAADTLLVDGSDSVSSIKKIRKVSGYLLGACGDADIAQWFLHHFVPEIITDKLRLTPPAALTATDTFEGVVITPKGKIYLYTDKFMLIPIKAKYVATGSGQPIALGAMAVGASAIEAVRAGIKHDRASGGKVQYIKLGR